MLASTQRVYADPGEILAKAYGNFLAEYRSHLEAKFVDREGNPCSETTRGLLRPSHIIEDQRRYIGKETSRKWEQGEDLSIVEFECMEYRSKGKVAANAALIERIVKFGIRKLERETGIDHKTIILITKGKPVKLSTLRKLVRFLDAEEKRQLEERDPFHADTPDILPDLKEESQVLHHDLIKTFGTPEQIETLIVHDKRIQRLEGMAK